MAAARKASVAISVRAARRPAIGRATPRARRAGARRGGSGRGSGERVSPRPSHRGAPLSPQPMTDAKPADPPAPAAAAAAAAVPALEGDDVFEEFALPDGARGG